MAWRTARSSSVRQVSWLMPMVTCSETVSSARAAWGVPVGRYMLRPGLEQHLARLAAGIVGGSPFWPGVGWTSQSLEPWVWKTKTSWLSLCTAKPCDPGGVR